jgi:putative FmdB family regulatory protein
MPTYLYKCVRCSRQEDIVHGIEESHHDSCICGGEMKKVFSSNGIIFKGPGFYRTDSRGK